MGCQKDDSVSKEKVKRKNREGDKNKNGKKSEEE
jgi:hypothetical protein